MQLASYTEGRWHSAQGELQTLVDATTGEDVAEISRATVRYAGALTHARSVGGPALRRLTFHERASLLKTLAKTLSEQKGILNDLSRNTGATQADCLLDVDGGLGTLFSYASRGLRELPNSRVYIEGAAEILSKSGEFVGQHICVPLEGAALHINAFNFPVWGMLEKFAPTFLAGVPAIVKPASATAYVTEKLVRQILDTALLPEGSLQLICGPLGDLFDHLSSQDAVAFTGSAETARKLRGHPVILRESIRFTAETDSLNSSILGPDASPESPEFALFVAEVVREMQYKAGQRCTAIRRAFVPAQHLEAASTALRESFEKIVVGDPRDPEMQMGPLVSIEHRRDVLARIKELRKEAELVTAEPEDLHLPNSARDQGAFLRPTLLRVRDPHAARAVHSVEAFGPVCTVMPYDSIADAIALAKLGGGSLVASAFTADPGVARELIIGLAPYHGRVLIVDRDCGKEQTGHGSPMPGLIHGGPGRAGGGEELGGIRAVLHYMQRTAVQGTPKIMATLVGA